jgi:regulator of cell morphogenesis and NO signaling
MSEKQQFPTLGQMVAERPAAARIFERLGLDYCCGGKQPLDEACAALGLKVADVQRELDAAKADAAAASPCQRDWLHAQISDLCEHILTVHHSLLRRELPRLSALVGKVAQVHGGKRPELAQVERLYTGLRGELEQHMLKEEQVLFPLCETLEQSHTLPECHCGSVNNPISVMEREHESAGEALHTIRKLTDNYTPPECACASYRAMLQGLAELEADLHQHIHEENNILFPRAAAREAALASCAV